MLATTPLQGESPVETHKRKPFPPRLQPLTFFDIKFITGMVYHPAQ